MAAPHHNFQLPLSGALQGILPSPQLASGLLLAGTNVSISYSGGKYTINSSGGGGGSSNLDDFLALQALL